MQALLAWICGPALLLVICFGLGLLADRVTRAELPGSLLAPVGLAVFVLVSLLVYKLKLTAPAAAIAVTLPALAGLVLARRGLRERLPGAPVLLAGLVVYALYLAPVALSGEPTWAGYNFVNDTASHLLYADQLMHHGTRIPPQLVATGDRTVDDALHAGYPLGAHAVLATGAWLSGAHLYSLYQPLIALLAALAAMALAQVARGAGLRPWPSAAAGAFATTGALLYAYTLHGSLKEIALVALLAAMAGLVAVALERRLPVGQIALLAVCALASVAAFSAAAAPYALVLGAGMIVAALLAPPDRRPDPRHLLRVVGVAVVVGLVALAPLLGGALDFVHRARHVFAEQGGVSTGYLGHLLRPLPLEQVAGVWIARDYRGPVSHAIAPLNSALIALAVALALVGLAVGLARRRPAVILLLAAVGLPAAALAPGLSPYGDGKLLLALSPAVGLATAVGAFSLLDRGRRELSVVGVVALACVALGALASDGLAYRASRLAPLDRMRSIEDAARHARGGMVLFNEWEEFAKYFGRDATVNAAFESGSSRPAMLRRPQPIFGRWYDLDREQLRYVLGFPTIVMRRSPAASRPPAPYRLAYSNRYYEVWRRGDATRVRRHLPLQLRDSAVAVPPCSAVRSLAAAARAGDRLVASRRAQTYVLVPAAARRPPSWQLTSDPPNSMIPSGSGRADWSLALPRGRYRVWLQASSGRKLELAIDRHRIGAAKQVNTPEQWLEVGQVGAAAGRHPLSVRRPGSGPGPSDGYTGTIGPLALESRERAGLVSVAPRRAASLCGRSWDWIELVHPRHGG